MVQVQVDVEVEGGSPRQVLDAAREATITLYTSSVLLDELAEVFSREHLAPIIAAHQATPAFLMRRYAMLAQLVFPVPIARVVPKDIDDDAVIACAIAAHADLIITGDKHFLDLKEHQGIRIVSATKALQLIHQP